MSDKSEFHGDVGQVVMGNVNEAPRLNNIVNVVIGGEKEEARAITELQRTAISEMVDEIVAAKTGFKRLDVYRIVLREFGAAKIKEMPRDRYQDVMAMLARLLADAKSNAVHSATEHSPADLTMKPVICPTCGAKAASSRHLLGLVKTQSVAILVMFGVAGWLFFYSPSGTAINKKEFCHLDGRTYSIGSTAKMQNGEHRICMQPGNNARPYWESEIKQRD